MTKRIFVAVVAALAVAGAASSPALSQSKKKTGTEASQPSAARAAVGERRKKCGIEWKEAKAAGKIEKGQRWPQFWSACNKRLKAAGA
jgi:hypothetical protein